MKRQRLLLRIVAQGRAAGRTQGTAHRLPTGPERQGGLQEVVVIIEAVAGVDAGASFMLRTWARCLFSSEQ